ncbi:PaaI family thioesterase [Rhodococcus cerastii]|nr:PaaI family thioesterase [Rhodococcus cerastii]
MRIAASEVGKVSARFAPQPWMSSVLGAIQGGVLLSAADCVIGFVAQSLATVGQPYRVLDLRMDFVRSAHIQGDDLHVEGTAVRAGRRISLIEARLYDAVGHPVAFATASAQLL